MMTADPAHATSPEDVHSEAQPISFGQQPGWGPASSVPNPDWSLVDPATGLRRDPGWWASLSEQERADQERTRVDRDMESAAQQRGRDELRERREQSWKNENADAIELAKTRKRVERIAEAELADDQLGALPRIRSLRDAIVETEAEYDNPHAIDRLWPCAGNVLAYAQAKVGKSTLVLNLTRSIVDDDEPFLNNFSSNIMETDKSVALIDLEMSYDMHIRWLQQADIKNTTSVHSVSLRGQAGLFKITNDRRRAQWARQLGDIGSQFLVIDPLGPLLEVCGLNEDSSHVGELLQAIDALTSEADVTGGALVTHHAGHDPDRPRGSSRLLGWPDAIWRLKRRGGAVVFDASGRDVDVPSTELAYDPAGRRLSLADGSTALGGRTKVFRGLLAAGLTADTTQAELVRAVRAAGLGVRNDRKADLLNEWQAFASGQQADPFDV